MLFLIRRFYQFCRRLNQLPSHFNLVVKACLMTAFASLFSVACTHGVLNKNVDYNADVKILQKDAKAGGFVENQAIGDDVLVKYDEVPLRIALIGGPGVGKGFQSSLLAQRYGIPTISVGALLRDVTNDGGALGKTLKKYMSNGNLVPGDIVFQILTQRLSKNDCARGFILDGFPREVEQAITLNKWANAPWNDGQLIIVNLDVSESVLRKRLHQRMVCARECNVNNDKVPPVGMASVCANCAGDEVIRQDDNEEVFKKRFDTYNKTMEPLLKYYRKNYTGCIDTINGDVKKRIDGNCYVSVDASGDRSMVFRNVSDAIDKIIKSGMCTSTTLCGADALKSSKAMKKMMTSGVAEKETINAQKETISAQKIIKNIKKTVKQNIAVTATINKDTSNTENVS